MTARHVDAEVVPYVLGELASEDRARVETHLAACRPCRETAASFRTVLTELVATRAQPPAVHWSRWQAELRRKLDSRLERSRTPPHEREVAGPRHARLGWHAVPLALSGALAAVLLYLAVHGIGQEPRVPQLVGDPRPADLTLDETIAGRRLDMLRHYSVVERLDLLEDLDVIGNLDRLADVKEGRASAMAEG
ncbi:MAG: zf-HC2 domain-containing protein [Candidatus Rokubacteria bacterium]|nr:zf-HC2 domain-containing protein [Candidatus Rokubacteria bacterium]